MAAGNWSVAADWYRRVIAITTVPEIEIQLAHALKEAGKIDQAERVYAAVSTASDVSTEAKFHRAVLLGRLDRPQEAIDELAAVLLIDGDHRGAFAELLQLGGRNRLPENFQADRKRGILPMLATDISRLRRELDALEAASVFPIRDYDAYRQAHPVPPPPARLPRRPLSIVIDARGAGPAFIRTTLLSLIDQTFDAWTAVVMADEAVSNHTVKSLSHCDLRISFVSPSSVTMPSGPFIHLSAGTRVEVHALSWFSFVLSRTNARAVSCDFEFGTEDAEGLVRYRAPQLWGAYDRDLLAQTATPHAMILVDPEHVSCPSLIALAAAEWRRRVLINAVFAVHIPRLLAAVLSIPDNAAGAPDDGELATWPIEPEGSPPPLGSATDQLTIVDRDRRPRVSISPPLKDDRIAIIMQTRDGGGMLAKAVDTMRKCAANPSALKIVIVDNRSQDSETLDYLASLDRDLQVTVIRHNEPFNWARANNIAVQDLADDIFVFANDDIQMLTPRWDELLLGYLHRSDVGAVGARLLYPDGSIQHAGILFGVGKNGPIHDGMKTEARNTGPLDRYDLTHAVAAVTGAFMGVSRTVFSEAGGFDEVRLAIAYNDIDFCLRVRAGGHKILYTPAIELLHYESKTRGLNVGRSRVAWDLGEFNSLRRLWPAAWSKDPGYNPQWSRDRAFDGFREPPMRELLNAIDGTARADPWRVSRASCD